jgi:hypothetical protein
MLGQSATLGATRADNRIFVYEVTGLSQNDMSASQQSPIRSSHSQLMQVPFHRMNEEMRRITLLGGEIVNIYPLNQPKAAKAAEPAQAVDNQPEDAPQKPAETN